MREPEKEARTFVRQLKNAWKQVGQNEVINDWLIRGKFYGIFKNTRIDTVNYNQVEAFKMLS